jgi:hypothetical protein
LIPPQGAICFILHRLFSKLKNHLILHGDVFTFKSFPIFPGWIHLSPSGAAYRGSRIALGCIVKSKGAIGVKNGLTIAMFALSLFLCFSCAEKIVSECDQQANIESGNDVTFSQIQNEILTPSCVFAGCHSGQFAAASLDLSASKSYDNLVNVASLQVPSLKLVLPENSGQSYLVRKLRGDNTSVMPPGGVLENDVIEAVVTWIDSGAPEN